MEEKFKEIAARYCSVPAGEIKDEMSFRNDLGLSSLDLMTFLGDLEDEFDVEFDFDDDEDEEVSYGDDSYELDDPDDKEDTEA